MKTFRVYLKCYVDIEANSADEAEDTANEMDYSFSHNADDFNSEIFEIEEVVEQKP
jgi:hypothetical protein